MRLGIVGPTKWQKNCKIIKVKEKKYSEENKKIAAAIKKLGFDIVVNPHFGGISHAFATEFRHLGGKVIGIIPKQDNEFGIDYLDQGVCSETIDCGTWRNYAEKFNEETQAMLCLGYSTGVLNEIAFSKWFGPPSLRRCETAFCKKAGENFSRTFSFRKGSSAIAGAIPQKPKKVLVVKEFVSAQLPKESVKDLNIEYISLKQVEKKLKQLVG